MSSLDIRISSEAFKMELIKISTGIVWKNQYQASLYESSCDPREVDQFMSANKGLINFDGLWDIDYDILEKSGMTKEQISRAMDNKYQIPETKRDLIVSMQLKRMLEIDPVTGRYKNYTEKNDYYRMLYGLPGIEEDTFLYLTDDPKIDPLTPVHELPVSDCYYLEEAGYFDELLKSHPTHKYLKYLGKKRIDPYTARSAERYDILWMQKSENDAINEAFADVYDNCRQLVIRTYFRRDLVKSNTYYEGFMAMCILFMAVNLMNYKFLEADITRDFFDVESLRFVYESYGVPFFPNIPISYHKAIVKNLNILLSYKGSTRVFFELFDLFDYADIDIYLYYIMKKHKMNSQGLPIFVYKEDGTIDNSATYEVRFGQVRLYDNPPLELSDPANQFDYQQVVADDPYWVSDVELMEKLYNQKYNYMESKYLGIRTIFDMMKIVYESAYLIKLLTDNREELNKTAVFFNATSDYHNIFSLTMYMCAIVCKKHGYDTLISAKLPSVAKYLGYNFKADLTAIRKFILNDPNLKDDKELLENIRYMDVNSMESINNTFQQIMDFRRFILERMWAAQTVEEYASYKHLYNTMLISDLIPDVFKKSDGTVAETFEDLLGDIDVSLYERLQSLEGNDLDTELDLLFALYKRSLSNIKWINLSDGINIGPLMEQLYSLMKYFKSAKAELTGYQVIYTISTPAANFFKLLGYIESQEHDGVLPEDRIRYLADVLHDVENMYKIKDRWIMIRDECSIPEDWYYVQSEIDRLTDLLVFEEHWICAQVNSIPLTDAIHLAEDERVLTSLLKLADEYKLDLEDVLYEEIHYAFPDDDALTLADAILGKHEYLEPLISNGVLTDVLMKIVDDVWLYTQKEPSTLDLSDWYQFVDSESSFQTKNSFDSSIAEVEFEYVDFQFKSRFIMFQDRVMMYSENNVHNDNSPFQDQLKLIEETKIE